MANRRTLQIIDGSDTYNFSIAPTEEGGRGLVFEQRAWEPGDPRQNFRTPLHPFIGGLQQDRLMSRLGYAKANADASFENLLLFPPKLNDLTFTNATTPPKAVELDGFTYVMAGRYIYEIDNSDYSVDEDKDFGAGKAAVDMAVFNNELIVAMGESEKIWKRTAGSGGTWTQATDNTFAIALGVVGDKLWRADNTNELTSCLTTPLTLTNWIPSDPFLVGDSTYPVNTIIDYGGTVWCGKADGMYAANPVSKFFNQTLQLARRPHTDNCKGAFTAQGALWVPSSSGLLRIRPGESLIRGPEITGRPDYRFWVRGGIEFGGSIYLLVTDEAGVEDTAIIKMDKDYEGYTKHEYRYHEWVRLGASTKGYFITISSTPTNPTIYCGFGNNAKYIKLGRGGGRDIDDSNYEYGKNMTLETGEIVPGDDLTVRSVLIGVETLLNYPNAPTEVTETISTTTDDGWENLGTASLITSAIVAGYHTSVLEMNAFLRFQSVALAQGQNISQAFLKLNIASVSGSPNTTVYGVDEDDAAAFSDPGNLPSAATRTTASTAFAPTSTGLKLIDVTDIVQEIVDRGGWSTGNDIAFVIDDEVGSGDNFWSADDESDGLTTAQLVITHSGEALTVSYAVDEETSFTDMLNTQEGAGTAPINGTDGYETIRRYAAINTLGQMFKIKFTGILDAASGTDRPEIREAWAWGYLRPRMTDFISVAILAEKASAITATGTRKKLTAWETIDILRNLSEDGKVVEIKINDYDESNTIRAMVASLRHLDAVTTLGNGREFNTNSQIQVEFIRTPFDQQYAQ